MSGQALETLEPLILRTRGAYFEGDVCAALKTSPYFVRGFEFALADGAIDCTAEHDPATRFADRFWNLDNRQYDAASASEIALLDVKSCATDAQITTTIGQRRRVAAYICVNAGDPTYVDVIPNFFQDAAAFDSPEIPAEDRLNTVVTHWKRSRLPVSSYGMMGPSTSPYRMPLYLLQEAIRLMRCHIRGEGTYQNPWTGVSFPRWQPITTWQTSYLKPSEAGHQSACDAVLDIYQAVRHCKDLQLQPDFVGLQPRLADFKLVRDGQPQRFVQHKLEGRVRGRHAMLDNVPIARGGDEGLRFYFSAFDRFDFLFYEFEFSQLPNPVSRKEFVFVPERLIPDSFYSGKDKYVSFDIPEFTSGSATAGRTGYRIHKDEDGQWVTHIRDILNENPYPRKATMRPMRVNVLAEEVSTGESADGLSSSNDSTIPLRPAPHNVATKRQGRSEYAEIMEKKHRRFFYSLLNQCASRRSGLLVVLARNHPFGDFGYVRYKWAESEVKSFYEHYRPPQFVHTLPPNTEVLPVTYYTRHLECSYQGPTLTASEFHRINACGDHRLLFWDLGGPDATILAVVPSVDIMPTEAQRKVFQSNLYLQAHEWRSATPNLSSLLQSGLHASEYTIPGEDVFSSHCWNAVWKFLDKFSVDDIVQHPIDHPRNPKEYRQSITAILSRLVDEHMTGVPTPESSEPDDS